jgi:hypothetical protein
MTQPTRSETPPAHDPGAEATGPFLGQAATVTYAPAGQPTAPPQVPGYEVLSELGRGGMGVVYKARHLALKRTVALKMILAAGHAGEAVRARFKAEAEAVARLQHPGIVQIHEVGEHQGCPFCALEFVEGGSLAQKLGGKPLPPKEAARLAEALARAVHLAHSRNVVHRDLKPANVLLTSEGAPKVTDFGLAKQLDAESGATQAGAIMGTPSYMAPEQAGGRTHEAGPPADVWALGAILYECLTGRPPFKGATVAETLDQVRTREPAPPRQGQPQTPRDLETICLKCLRKEPERRYASAAELADELGRFLHGEPVLARPVGRLERAARWARRNPALAAALAGVATGAVVASWLAVEAWRANGELDRKNADLASKNGELAAKNEKLASDQEEMARKDEDFLREKEQEDGTLARTWLSPLAKQPGSLTDPEAGALLQAMSYRGKPLALRLVREAVTDPAFTPALSARAEYVWQAALGLDRKGRDDAEQLLLAALRSKKQEAQRQDLALAASALGGLSAETAATAADALTEAMTETGAPDRLLMLAQGLAAVAARMEPAGAARVCGSAADILARNMSKTTDLAAASTLAKGLSAVAARLEPKAAGEAADALGQVLTRTTEAKGLLADLRPMQNLATALSDVAARLGPKEAAHSAAVLLQSINKATHPTAALTVAQSFGALAARMEPGDAAVMFSQALSATKDVNASGALARGLSADAPELQPKEAAEVAATLTQAMSTADDPAVLSYRAQGLSAVAGRLGPMEAPDIAARIGEALSKTTQTDALLGLAQGLSAAAGRMDPAEADRVCSSAAATLTQVMKKTPNGTFGSMHVAMALSTVGARMAPRQAAAALLQALNDASDPSALEYLAQGLSAAAARMDPTEAAAVCGSACTVLLRNLGMPTRPGWSAPLARGLAAAASRLGPKDAAGIADALTQLMNKSADAEALSSLAQGLSGVAGRMDPAEAARQCGAAAHTLTKAMSTTPIPGSLQRLADGLASLSVWMDPAEAGEAAGALAEAMSKTTDFNTLPPIAQALAAMAGRLSPKDAAADAALLLQAMTTTKVPFALSSQAQALSAVAARMEPKEGAGVCSSAAGVLLQAMSNSPDWTATAPLAAGLSAVAVRLEPKDASQVAAALTKALSKTTNAFAMASLVRTLSAVAARLESNQAAATAAVLTAAMSKTADADTLRLLADAMSSVLSRTASPDAADQRALIVAVVAASSGPAPLLAAPVVLRLALAPPVPGLTALQQLYPPSWAYFAQIAPPLPPQALVDLLKDPLCVGAARRAVMDQLSRHYGRPFADQWEFARFAEEHKLGLDLNSPPHGAGPTP